MILPLAKPALITVALLSFQGMWNNFLGPLVLLNTPDMFPLTVGLGFLKGQYGTFYNVVLAGSMFNTIPMVLLFTGLLALLRAGRDLQWCQRLDAARRGRDPGPLRLAFTRAVQDWYYGLIPFAVDELRLAVARAHGGRRSPGDRRDAGRGPRRRRSARAPSRALLLLPAALLLAGLEAGPRHRCWARFI